jgi:hypothetical protein
MTVPNSDPPPAGAHQAIGPTQAQAEQDRALIASLSARIRQLEERGRRLEERARQLEERVSEGTTTAQNFGGSSVA